MKKKERATVVGVFNLQYNVINSMRFSIVHFTCAYCRLDICHTVQTIYTQTQKTHAIRMRARHFAHYELTPNRTVSFN